MKNLRIYIDTSVIGGCYDEEFEKHSNELFEMFIKGDYRAVVSIITMQELTDAPEYIRQKIKTIPENNIDYIRLSPEAAELAQKYIHACVLNSTQLIDAQHIAIATCEKVDVITSWNFKHIVNLNKINGFNSVNIREGYSLIEIRSPREVIDEG